MATSAAKRYVIGVSLKMYFSHARTVQWCRAVARFAREHPAITGGVAELFVVPDYLAIPAALEIFGDRVAVGAQDLSTDDGGALTGEVSGATLAELGCTVVEVGHAERRRFFGDTDAVVRAKVAAAFRHGLTPVLCVGEAAPGDPADAAAECIRQLDDALGGVRIVDGSCRLIVAYEPVWAIGAAAPATAEHIGTVCRALRAHLHTRPGNEQPGSTQPAVIYGGSASPGLVTALADRIDGIFLGRFAHDPAALGTILDEVLALTPAAPAAAPAAPPSQPADNICIPEV